MNGNDPKAVEGLEQSRGEFRKIRDGESGHTHRYTVPVEWTTVPAHFELTNSINGAGINQPDKTAVTKLRCESCPEEIERK